MSVLYPLTRHAPESGRPYSSQVSPSLSAMIQAPALAGRTCPPAIVSRHPISPDGPGGTRHLTACTVMGGNGTPMVTGAAGCVPAGMVTWKTRASRAGASAVTAATSPAAAVASAAMSAAVSFMVSPRASVDAVGRELLHDHPQFAQLVGHVTGDQVPADTPPRWDQQVVQPTRVGAGRVQGQGWDALRQ